MTIFLLACGEAPQEELDVSRGAIEGVEDPSLWDQSVFPLTLLVSDSFDSNERAAIQAMGNAWENSTNKNFFNTDFQTSEKSITNLNQYRDNSYAVYKVTEWDNTLPATALAVTQIYGVKSNGRVIINHADILVNYDNFNFNTDMGPGYDLQTVILHEMGHFLGLYHSDTSTDSSVMFPSIGRFTINRTPKQLDIDALEAKYPSLSPAHSAVRSLASNPDENMMNQPVVIRMELHKDGRCVHHH